jgi:hypothetical protein
MLPHVNHTDESPLPAPVSFFRDLGNLHDAVVTQVTWNPVLREIAIVVDDLYANFVGLPEYPGLQRTSLNMAGVVRMQSDVTSDRFKPRILDLEIEQTHSAAQLRVSINFDASGSLTIECSSIACRPVA